MALIAAFAIGLVLTPLAIRLSRGTGLLDQPGDLKLQDVPVPIFGGLAAFGALLAPVALLGRPALLLPLAGGCALGTADDIRGLAPRVRLAAEIGLGVVVALTVAPDRPIGVVVALAGTVLLINAINLLDGIDGLAIGVGIVACLGFAVLLDGDGRVLALALGGALAAVLVWNRPPARVYLGDGGAYLIGVSLAVLLTSAWSAHQDAALGWAALFVVALPVADTATAIVRRARAGRPVFQGDRSHLYDRMVDRGIGVAGTSLRFAAMEAVLVVVALAIAALPARIAAVTTLGVMAIGVVLTLTVFTRDDAAGLPAP